MNAAFGCLVETSNYYQNTPDSTNLNVATLNISTAEALSEHMTGWQVIEVDKLLTEFPNKLNRQQLDDASVFALDLAQSGVSHDVNLSALRELCNLLSEGNSYDQSVFLVSEQRELLTPEAQRVLIFRFVSDVALPHSKDPDYKRQNFILADMLGFFFKKYGFTFEQRWNLIHGLLDATEGHNFDDRAQIINMAVLAGTSTVNYETLKVVILELQVLKRNGVSPEVAVALAEYLIQNRTSLHEILNETLSNKIGGPTAAAAA